MLSSSDLCVPPPPTRDPCDHAAEAVRRAVLARLRDPERFHAIDALEQAFQLRPNRGPPGRIQHYIQLNAAVCERVHIIASLLAELATMFEANHRIIESISMDPSPWVRDGFCIWFYGSQRPT